jgi:flotillin
LPVPCRNRQAQTKVRRPADAAAILARGQAEAKSMDARAEAFGTYGEAAILDLLVKVLPEVVGAAANAGVSDGVVHVPVVSADGDGPRKA